MNPRNHAKYDVKNVSLSLQSGLSLVELMVGITVGLLVSLAATTLLVSNAALLSAKSEQADMFEQASLTLHTLGMHVRQAGYGEINREKGFKFENPSNFRMDLPPVWGCDAGYSKPSNLDFSCNPFPTTSGAGQALPDSSLSLARLEPDSINNPWGEPVDCQGAIVPVSSVTGLREIVNHFYIENGRLMCRAESPDANAQTQAQGQTQGQSQGQAILDGVAGFRVFYGVSDANDAPTGVWSRATMASGVASLNTDVITAWRKVAWAEVCLLVATQKNGVAMQNMQYQNCDGQTVTATDKRVYKLFRERFALRNALR